MSSITPNIQLKIVDDFDSIDQQPYNDNSVIIDEQIASVKSDVNSLDGKITATNLAMHNHNNKAVIDRFAQDELGLPIYNGKSIGVSESYVNDKITELVGGAPQTRDTLKEISDILTSDESVTNGILESLGNKVDKVDGKELSSNDYSDDEKVKLGKFEEVGGKLTYNGAAIGKGGVEDWIPSNVYSIADLVIYHNQFYRCTVDHTSAPTFENTKWSVVDIGYIAIWQTNVAYERFTVVTRGNNIIRCITPHTSSDFGNVEKNYWEVLAGKGATLSDWQPNTDYELNEAVVYNFIIYKSTTAHRSSTVFSNDMSAGMEKWIAINGYSDAGSLKQLTELGVVAPIILNVIINYTTTFNLPPVEVLKFTPGLQDQVLTECKFDNSDATKFTVDGISGELSPWIVWDGTMKPRTSYNLTFSEPVTLSTGKTSESDWIDFSVYQSISAINVN